MKLEKFLTFGILAAGLFASYAALHNRRKYDTLLDKIEEIAVAQGYVPEEQPK